MSLATLAEIGIKAIALQDAVDKRRGARTAMREANAAFRSRYNRGEYIDRDTERHAMMLEDLAPQLRALYAAKYAERLARARLERACKKGRDELAAGAAAERIVRRAMESAS